MAFDRAHKGGVLMLGIAAAASLAAAHPAVAAFTHASQHTLPGPVDPVATVIAAVVRVHLAPSPRAKRLGRLTGRGGAAGSVSLPNKRHVSGGIHARPDVP